MYYSTLPYYLLSFYLNGTKYVWFIQKVYHYVKQIALYCELILCIVNEFCLYCKSNLSASLH